VPSLVLNRADCARVLAVDPKTLDAWREQGLPSLPGKITRYDLAAVVPWAIDHAKHVVSKDSYSDARRRKEIATATLKEIEAAEASGSFVNIKDVVGRLEDTLQVLMSRLLAIPGRVAQPADGKSAAQIQEIVAAEIQSALEEIQADMNGAPA
jgi:phage terminase Nu1 subunit (DNA packaging protein)